MLFRSEFYLFSEYDSLQDKSEGQGRQVKTLSKDLEQSVQECIRTKEKLAETESVLAEKNSRLIKVSSELAERQARTVILEDEKNRQDKTFSKLSSENKELVRKCLLDWQPCRRWPVTKL